MSWSKLNDLVLPLGIIGCLLVFLVPLPGAAMDVLLSANLGVALVVLLTTLSVQSPHEFSVFPTVLLATTLSRLVLNVATTRLILTQADSVGVSAAGDVIRHFGAYVSGDRLIVGLIMFAIIFVIQMLVITKGATRISEVAARFALDGIPGRQLAIDADLNAGVIDQTQAREQRAQINRQADFYGAMDGASKFVRGDAVASVIITLINLVGGLLIGLMHGMGLGDAVEVYSKLTIGDGLVSQLPALLTSLAAGLLVSRGSESANLPHEFLRQLFSRPQVMAIAAGFLVLLSLTHLPTTPLLVLAAGFIALAHSKREDHRPTPTSTVASEPPTDKPRAKTARKEPRVEDFLHVDPVEFELGRGLVKLASAERGGDLLARINKARQQVAAELGLVLPRVRVRDNLRLREQVYRIRVMGDVVAEGEIPPSDVVAIPPDGLETRCWLGAEFLHPAVDPPARLISIDQLSEAQAANYRLLAPEAIVVDHLRRVVLAMSHELLTRDATANLIEEVRKTSPRVVGELIPHVMKLSEVQQVLRGLLREGVPIRQLALILETLGDHAPARGGVQELIELVRRRLARTISARFRDEEKQIHVVTLDPQFEQLLAQAGREERQLLSPPEVATFHTTLRRSLARLATENRPPILLTSSELRLAVLNLAREVAPGLVVLGQGEISTDSRIRSVGIVGLS